MRPVKFFKDRYTDEIVTYCHYCVQQYGNQMVEIDLAGDWDLCSNCDAQNIPEDYEGEE